MSYLCSRIWSIIHVIAVIPTNYDVLTCCRPKSEKIMLKVSVIVDPIVLLFFCFGAAELKSPPGYRLSQLRISITF